MMGKMDQFWDFQNGVITRMVFIHHFLGGGGQKTFPTGWSEENAHVLAQSFAKIRKGKDEDLKH